MQGEEAGWLPDRVWMPGRGGSVFVAEGLGSRAWSAELVELTVRRVGLVAGWVALLVVWTGPLALGTGLAVV